MRLSYTECLIISVDHLSVFPQQSVVSMYLLEQKYGTVRTVLYCKAQLTLYSGTETQSLNLFSSNFRGFALPGQYCTVL